jgi:hypothetical protein
VGRLHKFIQTLDDDVYREISTRAQERGVSIQEFFRAVIVPDWNENRLQQARTIQSLSLQPENSLNPAIIPDPQTTIDETLSQITRRQSPNPQDKAAREE